MSEVKKIATRASYGNALVELGKNMMIWLFWTLTLLQLHRPESLRKHSRSVILTAVFAECNMMGNCCRNRNQQKSAVCKYLCNVLQGRAFEQVRNSAGYPKLNVKIGATHGGISVGEDGATHQCCEDFALMRTIPGMVVACPSDDIEAKSNGRGCL